MKEIRISNKYYCNRMRILEYLVKNGAEVLSQVPDIKNPSRTVWVFNAKDVVDLLNSYHKLHNNEFTFILDE